MREIMTKSHPKSWFVFFNGSGKYEHQIIIPGRVVLQVMSITDRLVIAEVVSETDYEGGGA